MLDVMSCLDEFDAIFFLPKDNDRIHIQSNVYKDKGTPIEGNEVGDKWHIILFQEDDDEDEDNEEDEKEEEDEEDDEEKEEGRIRESQSKVA